MRFFYSISFRIWFVCTILVMGMLLVFMIYYPARQKKLLSEFKKNELFETAESVSTAVVLSLKNDDYDGVRLAISHASEKKDFEFIAVVLEEAGKKTLLASYPETTQEKVIIQTNDELIYEEAPFEYGEFKGSIIIAVSKIKINNTIKALTQPIYITAFVFLIISVILFYILANQLSKPITKLIKFTDKLKEENYETRINKIESKNEIGVLHNSIAELQDNLFASKKRNKELTDGLEEEVLIRTTELKSTAEKLLQAQNSAGIGNFEYDIEKDAWEASPNVYDILKIPYRKSYPIDFFLNLLEEKDKESAIAFFSNINSADVKFEQDFKIYRNNNSDPLWIHFVYNVIFNSEGNAVMTRGTIQDITYRKKIEDELKELSLVAKNTSNYVIITDKDKKIKWVNDSILQVTGYTLSELLGKNPKIFQCEKTNPATIEYIRTKLANVEEVKTEILNRGKKGNEYWLELNIVPIKNDLGEVSGYIAVETDITEIKNSEENIRKLNESLEIRVLENTKKNLELSSLIVEQEKLATIGELAAGVAHDMNTPLSSTKVGAESLQFATKEIMRILPTLNPEEQKEAIDIAEKNKTNLAVSGLQKKKEEIQLLQYLKEKYIGKPEEELAIIANKLTECRINKDNETVIKKIFQSKNTVVLLELIYNIQLKNALIESILTSTENASSVVRNLRSFINKGITPERGLVPIEENIKVVLNIFQHELKKDIELEMQIEPELKVFGFDIKLFQIWSNLIKNSIEALDKQEVKKIGIKGYSNEQNVFVAFSNNGPEIPEENIQKIFRKFYSTKRSKSGTGLGLSIVKNVLEDHHAKINVTSTPELTTFLLSFPKPATA